MGGQACVFCGAAQVSKDIDLALLAEPAKIKRLRFALKELAAERIAVPPFDPLLFDRGPRCPSEAPSGRPSRSFGLPRGWPTGNCDSSAP